MTHEQFISLETAKLAKQAGFDWESHFDCEQQRDEWLQCASIEVPNPYYDETLPFSSPTTTEVLPHITQAVLQRWIREVKGYIVLVDYNEDEDCESDERYGVTIYKGNQRIVEPTTFATFEAALEAGLQKCLTKILEGKK